MILTRGDLLHLNDQMLKEALDKSEEIRDVVAICLEQYQ